MNNLFKLGIFLLIFLNLLPASFVRDTVDVNHFFSSVHMFEYAFQHGFQFGLDFVDNVGPYGYLHYPYIYAGGAFWSKSLWFALICFVYAYYAAALIGRVRSWPERGLFLFAIIFFPFQSTSPFLSFEVIPRLAILFSAIYFLAGSRAKTSWHENAHIIFNGLFYAFLTLEKASNVYYLVLLVFVLSAYWLSTNQWRNSLSLVGTYLFGCAVFWLAAGQYRLSGLLDYFASMSFFIDAYQENLGTEVGGSIFLYGLFYCTVAAALIIFRLRLSFKVTRPQKGVPEEVFRSILVAALFFLTWKHGIFRGVQSFGTFMYTVPILFAYLCFYPIAAAGEHSEHSFLQRLSSWPAWISRSTLFIALLLVVWSNIISANWDASRENSYKVKHFSIMWREFSNRFSDLVHYRPAQLIKDMDGKLERLRQENALPPSLKQAMKLGRVDEFGSVPEVIFLNDLDYRPRPIPITFIASNAALNEKNGRYYQNVATAPDYVLLDGDFGFRVSDSSAYLSLLFNYQAVNAFKNWLVLEKRASTWQHLELQKLQESKAHFGEWVSLAAQQKSFLWLEVDAESSFLGKIKRFFYKPDYVRLDILLEDGSTRSMLISLAQLRAGFFLNPFFKTKNEHFIAGQSKTDVPWYLVKAFRIAMSSPDNSHLFQKKFKVKFSAVASSSTSDAPRKPIDTALATSLINLTVKSFPVDVTKFPIDLFSNEKREDFNATGMSGLESNGTESWRWATGPSTRISFYVDPALPETASRYLLRFAFKNGASIPDQSVTIRLNEKDVYHFSAKEISSRPLIDAEVALAAKRGINVLEFVYQDWNHGKKDYAPDPRLLAVVIMRLSLDTYPTKIKFPKESSLIQLHAP